ncbi:hypothetical protein [Parapedobacter lycopersici]|uniref:hypothetical protein n=1 Tax=Parapedobacter lycopersici TaxID=1864939 RepID=UPI00214D9697|nr:hypothetical protein [Parapedobacter lycopersici]
MAQEDYLKKQIDQLGLVLARLFSDLLGRKDKGQLNDGIETINQALENGLGLDIQKLADIPSDNLIDTLKTQQGLTNESLDKLADILLFIADNNPGDHKKLYAQCLTIYEHLEKTDSTYVLDRHWKIERIKKALS